MSQFTTSSASSGSHHVMTTTANNSNNNNNSRYMNADITSSTLSMNSGLHRDDDSSTVSELPESPTLPPEMQRGDDVAAIPRTSTDYPRSPTQESNLLRSYASMPAEQLSPSASYPHMQTTSPPPISQPLERTRSAQTVPSRPKQQHVRHVSSHNNLQPRRSKRAMPDHMAAALELSASPSVPPAPAAGMYWSRSVTYGRGPSRPLRAHTINLIGEQLFVFGGCDIKTCFNALYVLDMDTMTWSKPRTLGQPPPPCRAHSSTLVERDLGSGKRAHYLYIFGGGDGPNYFNDLYVLNADTLVWSKPATEGIPPSPRRAHTTCLWNDKIVVMGGGDGARALSDVHILDISDPSRPRWSQLSTSGVPPIARGYHTSNLVKDKLIVFGGSDGHECFSDVHVLDLVTNRWTQVELDRIVPRLAHSATQVGSYVFVIGGHDGSRYSNEVLLLNLVTMSWESRRIYGGAPSPRGYHAAVLHDSRLYVLGGYDGKTVFDDVYMLELSACAYLPQITNFEIDL